MQAHVQVTARGFELRRSLRERIEMKAGALGRFDGRITACRVVVESPNHHHRKGRVFRVRINVGTGCGLIVMERESSAGPESAIEKAFDATARRLEDRPK
ncbi:MAG: ribosome-associated translation inhibitor RaiA [Elusimicrobia bacterium]|nr:ribosome-associated translation inhibitor RaiA [Elusimicrobiota bacterium]